MIFLSSSRQLGLRFLNDHRSPLFHSAIPRSCLDGIEKIQGEISVLPGKPLGEAAGRRLPAQPSSPGEQPIPGSSSSRLPRPLASTKTLRPREENSRDGQCSTQRELVGFLSREITGSSDLSSAEEGTFPLRKMERIPEWLVDFRILF
jgi:hypothetical protein